MKVIVTLLLACLLCASSSMSVESGSDVSIKEVPVADKVEPAVAAIKADEVPESLVNKITRFKELVKPVRSYYDVPLDESLQDYIFELCSEHELDPAIVIAMIKVESSFRPSTMGDDGDAYGLMQIQPKWHSERMERLGISVDELLDPFNNVTVGVDYLAELLRRDKGLEWALMAYNSGFANANRHIKAGTVSKYCKKVLDYAEKLNLQM